MSKYKPNNSVFGQQVRLAYLEARLFLDGEFYTKKLMQFGYTRQCISSDINLYLKTYGKVMNYCPFKKRFILDRRFKPKILAHHQLAAYARYVESIFQVSSKSLSNLRSDD